MSILKREEEIKRRRTLQNTLGSHVLPVAEAVTTDRQPSGIQLYDFAAITSTLKTTAYAVTRMSEITKDETNRPNIHISESISRDGTRELTSKLNYSDELGYYSTRMVFHSHTLAYCQCNCVEDHDTLCEHMLLLIRAAHTYAVKNAPSDLTDNAAASFFRSLQDNSHPLPHPREVLPEKRKVLTVAPRISVEDGIAKLTFKIGHAHAKPIIYTYYKFKMRYLSDPVFNQYPYWIAHYYVDKVEYKGEWKFWQHTDVGKLPGIKGNVDFNIYNGSYYDLRKLTIGGVEQIGEDAYAE